MNNSEFEIIYENQPVDQLTESISTMAKRDETFDEVKKHKLKLYKRSNSLEHYNLDVTKLIDIGKINNDDREIWLYSFEGDFRMLNVLSAKAWLWFEDLGEQRFAAGTDTSNQKKGSKMELYTESNNIDTRTFTRNSKKCNYKTEVILPSVVNKPVESNEIPIQINDECLNDMSESSFRLRDVEDVQIAAQIQEESLKMTVDLNPFIKVMKNSEIQPISNKKIVKTSPKQSSTVSMRNQHFIDVNERMRAGTCDDLNRRGKLLHSNLQTTNQNAYCRSMPNLNSVTMQRLSKPRSILHPPTADVGSLQQNNIQLTQYVSTFKKTIKPQSRLPAPRLRLTVPVQQNTTVLQSTNWKDECF